MAKLRLLVLNSLPVCESIVFPARYPTLAFAEVCFAGLCGCETYLFLFPLCFTPLSIFTLFPLFFLLESSNVDLVLVNGLIKPGPLWVGVSEESYFEYLFEGEATMLYELGEQERFLQTMQRGTELVCEEGNLTL